MSAAASKPPATLDVSQVSQDRCECLKCGRVLPTHHIMRNIMEGTFGADGELIVMGWCEHCDTVYEVRRVVRGGTMGMTGGPRIVTDKARVDSLKRKIEFLQGDKRISGKSLATDQIR